MQTVDPLGASDFWVIDGKRPGHGGQGVSHGVDNIEDAGMPVCGCTSIYLFICSLICSLYIYSVMHVRRHVCTHVFVYVVYRLGKF